MQLKENLKTKRTMSTFLNIKNAAVMMLKNLKICLFLGGVIGCSDFVEVDLPKNQLNSETVFNNAATATSALKSMYAKLRDQSIPYNFSIRLGYYTDELEPGVSTNSNEFYNHTISRGGGIISSWWRDAYNIIYATNAVIEGVENSTSLSVEDKAQFIGEALFIRGYMHFLLVNVFGPVPYITTTDYIANTRVSRDSEDIVYEEIINDLTEASGLLKNDISGERVQAYKQVAQALLARVHLYSENWEKAETIASSLISNFTLELDLNKVFLKNASGSIWQLKPELSGENTRIGFDLIFTESPGTRPSLTTAFVEDAFSYGDLRKTNWVKEVTKGTDTWYHAYKYKELGDTFILNGQNEEVPISFEYPVMFRLAEQYLIRAEARAKRNNISGAQEDLNIIRNRAGLPNTTATSVDALLDAILQERRVELFIEHGHRWFDLKRTGKAARILTPIKSNWQERNLLFPVPEAEILLNPNLLPQNDGYN